MDRVSPGERHTMHVRLRSEPYGGEVENVAYCEPKPLAACKVSVGMVVSVMPQSASDRPRKFVVKSKVYVDCNVEVDGKLQRIRRIFFNGNGARKFDLREPLLVHFTPHLVRDGIGARPGRAEPVTTDEEKAANAEERARRQAELARIIAKHQR